MREHGVNYWLDFGAQNQFSSTCTRDAFSRVSSSSWVGLVRVFPDALAYLLLVCLFEKGTKNPGTASRKKPAHCLSPSSV